MTLTLIPIIYYPLPNVLPDLLPGIFNARWKLWNGRLLPFWYFGVTFFAAIALGANMVEKTITHDRATRSVEHMFSLEPADMAAFVRAVRELEIALGATRKRLSETELANRVAIRRSAHVRRAVRAGDAFDMDTIEFRRPGRGIAPDAVEQYLGMRYARDMKAGQIVHPADLTGQD